MGPTTMIWYCMDHIAMRRFQVCSWHSTAIHTHFLPTTAAAEVAGKGGAEARKKIEGSEGENERCCGPQPVDDGGVGFQLGKKLRKMNKSNLKGAANDTFCVAA